MRKLVEKDLIKGLKRLVTAHTAPTSHPDTTAFNTEKKLIMKEFMELEEEGAWWSDVEWERFLIRSLNFLEAVVR